MLRKIHFPLWSLPLALLAVGIAAFGLLMPRLGFYWDDWAPFLVKRLYGSAGFWDFYAFDRPASAWSFVIFVSLLGARPLVWQVFALLLRWLAAVAMGWTFLSIWPKARYPVTAAALLFMVYPVFTQQSMAVTYHPQWLDALLFFISLGAMVQAARQPDKRLRFALYTLLGVAAMALNYSLLEYYVGVDLLRPVLLWILLREVEPSLSRRAGKTFLLWLPYLLTLGLFVFWRMFLVHLPVGDVNKPVLLYRLFSQPLQALRELTQVALRDVVQTLVSSWYSTLTPDLFNLSRPFMLLVWLAALLTAAACAFYLYHQTDQDKASEGQNGRRWAFEAGLVGLLAVLLGTLPAWLTGRFMVADLASGQAAIDPFSDRYVVPGMFGAALLLVAFLEWLTPHRLQKSLLIGMLLGLAVGLHLRTANDYRWFWVEQQRFIWQLHWRAPSIQPGTALLAKDDIFPLQGRFATSMALNLAYPQPEQPEYLNTWVISLERQFAHALPELRQGVPLDESFRTFKFKGSTRDGLVVNYDPDSGTCLWVLEPGQTYAPGLSEVVRQALPVSNLERIGNGETPGYPSAQIFGAEPEHTWCYYFEKAELARQQDDWSAVTRLEGEARAKGYAPGKSGSDTSFEWLPFVEAYAREDQWPQALALTRDLSQTKRVSNVDGMLCQFWGELRGGLPASAGKEDTLGAINQELGCQW